MLTLYDELFVKISKLLADNEKIKLTATSKTIDRLKHKFMYTDKTDVRKIRNLPFFNNFEYVEIPDIIHKCPKNVKHIKFVASCIQQDRYRHIIMQFDYFFGQFKDGAITSLKSVTIEDNYDNPIKYCLPSSVTHLTFGKYFSHSIEKIKKHNITFGEQLTETDIPISITHLTFGDVFNQPIKNCIPSSVTHLEFGISFDQSLNSIPLSIQEIKICNTYNKIIDIHLIPKITIKNI
jgi:hypothetical protein